jgi:hypothetical protein
MARYKDGTPAQVGDIVRGMGYNVTGPDGRLKEIVGQVISITRDAATCSLSVAFIKRKALPADFRYPDSELFSTHRGLIIVGHEGEWSAIQADMEYGQADHFEKIC